MNTITVHILGNVLNRGQAGFGGKTTGRTVTAKSAEEARRRLGLDRREILVTPVLTEAYRDLIPGLAGIILEEESQIPPEEISAANPELVCIARVPGAFLATEDGITVTLDGEEKIIYEGTIL
jgi:pyruvate kinase